MPDISLKNLKKIYNGSQTPAVNGINLTVEDGEFMCLLGPSGCGKTTILRMIAGIEHSSDGEIIIDHQIVDSVRQSRFIPAESRRVGLVFQNYALWPHMTVERNVDFGLRLQKVPAAQRKARCQDVMVKLRIAEYANRYPSQLSGGQQQRVALARMLAVNPKVLLLDEPLSNLDASLRLEMRSELRRIHETFGTTIIFVSHDQWEAMTLATTIAVMDKGNIQQVGTPDEIYTSPNNRFVAEFIGNPKINLLDLRPESLKKHPQLATYLEKYDFRNVETQWCGIRPESVILSRDSSQNAITATIENIIPTGGSWVIELRHGEQRIFHSTQLRPNWQPDEIIFCQLPQDALHFFDKKGQRLSVEDPSSAVLNDPIQKSTDAMSIPLPHQFNPRPNQMMHV